MSAGRCQITALFLSQIKASTTSVIHTLVSLVTFHYKGTKIFGKAQLTLFTGLSHIPHTQPLLLRVAQSVSGAASGTGAPGNTVGGAVYQMPVSGEKGLTAGRLAADDHLVYHCLYRRCTGLLGECPAVLVTLKRLCQNNTYLRSALP